MAEASFTIRAVDATRAAFLNVQNSLAQLKQSSATAAAFMKKVFDPRALGAGLASALGISLVGAIDMAVAAIGRMVSRFEDVRRIVNETKVEVAKIYEDAADALLRPDQMLVKLGEKRKALEAEIAVLRKRATPVREEIPVMMPGAAGSMKTVIETVEATAKETQLLQEKELALAGIVVDQDKLKRILDQSGAAALLEKENQRLQEQEERIGLAKGKVDLLTSSFDDYISKVREGNDERDAQRANDEAALLVMQAQADAQKDILDPTRELQREIALVNTLEKQGLLTLEEAIMRRAQLTAQIQGMTTAQTEAMVEANAGLTEMQQLAQDVGDTIASSFEDAIFTGQKLSQVLRQLALDLMRMLFNQMVTQQLAASIGTFFGMPPLPGRAVGGSVTGRSAYLVGERGPEVFVPGTSGAIVPNSRLRSEARTGAMMPEQSGAMASTFASFGQSMSGLSSSVSSVAAAITADQRRPEEPKKDPREFGAIASSFSSFNQSMAGLSSSVSSVAAAITAEQRRPEEPKKDPRELGAMTSTFASLTDSMSGLASAISSLVGSLDFGASVTDPITSALARADRPGEWSVMRDEISGLRTGNAEDLAQMAQATRPQTQPVQTGTTVNVSYNIQSGVSRAELAPILESERKRLKAEIPDMVRRGGSYRAAFA